MHDFNPGIRNDGLFWTTVVPEESVQVDLGAGTANYSLRNARMPDFHDFGNAVNGGGITTPGVVSFKVTWEAQSAPTAVAFPTRPLWRNAAPAIARMEWSGRSGEFEFQSRPIGTSSSEGQGALLGEERNGTMY